MSRKVDALIYVKPKARKKTVLVLDSPVFMKEARLMAIKLIKGGQVKEITTHWENGAVTKDINVDLCIYTGRGEPPFLPIAHVQAYPFGRSLATLNDFTFRELDEDYIWTKAYTLFPDGSVERWGPDKAAANAAKWMRKIDRERKRDQKMAAKRRLRSAPKPLTPPIRSRNPVLNPLTIGNPRLRIYDLNSD